MRSLLSRRLQLILALLLALSTLPMGGGDVSAATGSLNVFKKNSAGVRLPNACFGLFAKRDNGQRGTFVRYVCDGYDSVVDGKTSFTGLAGGAYLVAEMWAPVGYSIGPDKSVTIVDGARTQVSVTDLAGGTTVIVSKVSSSGTLLKNACFNIHKDAGSGALGNWILGNCDSFSTADGKTELPGLRAGNYVLVESQAPAGYKPGANKRFTASGSGLLRLTMTNQAYPAGDTVTIKKVDPNGAKVLGACFGLYYPISNPNAPNGVDLGAYAGKYACDGDHGATDGTIKIFGVPAGNYVALEYYTPPGYVVAPIRAFTKVAGTAKSLTITDRIGGTTLAVKTRTAAGEIIKGACFWVHRSVGTERLRGVFVTHDCDGWDGALDGTVHLTNLSSGSYLLILDTSLGYTTGRSIFVSLASNSFKTITVTLINLQMGAVEVAESAAPSATTSPTATAQSTETATVEPTPTAQPTETATAEPTVAPTDAPATEAPTEAPAEPTMPATEGTPSS